MDRDQDTPGRIWHGPSFLIFDPPPADAPSGVIAQMRIGRAPSESPPAIAELLVTDPVSDEELDQLTWYLEDYWKWPYEGFAARGAEVERMLAKIGERLHRAVVAMSGTDSLQLDEIVIVSDVPAILALPWELLHDGKGFLALGRPTPTSIVRRLAADQADRAPPLQLPLRVLLITARPEGTPHVDQRIIARELLRELDDPSAEAIELEFLRPPTLEALFRRLGRAPPVHVLHFDGHGVFRPGAGRAEGGQGALVFEDGEGRAAFIVADVLAKVMRRQRVPLGVLTACQSATLDRRSAFGSVATQLVRGGVDAVVAMSASVLTVSAAQYSKSFYRALARGAAAPAAHKAARQALHDDPCRHVHQRREDEEGGRVVLVDWWLPHLYTKQPLSLSPETELLADSGLARADATAAARPRPTGAVPPPPRYGFSGRARELLAIERHLYRRRLVVLRGFGGIGKTALASETADWLLHTGMYTGARVVSFEHGGDGAMLLSDLGWYLGLFDGSFDPADTGASLQRVRSSLADRPTLLVVDSIETVLASGDAPLSEPDLDVLSDLLLSVADIPGCGVLLTTRGTNLDAPRLADGDRVRHLALGGLHPDDAYQLATQMLASLNVSREQVPFVDLRELLVELNHHPLAIQLVMPLLMELPIATVRRDLAVLLPRVRDEDALGRNRSLLASLDYSLRRLTVTEQALLANLVVFEGGATELLVPSITEISGSAWEGLRHALERSGLLTPELVHQALPERLLHFHPVLIPYLRALHGTGGPKLVMRYCMAYLALANHIYNHKPQDSERLSALERREFPNFLRAFDLFLSHGHTESATLLYDCLTDLLAGQGMGRIREQLRRRLLHKPSPDSTQVYETLTQEEYLAATVLGEEQLEKGDVSEAYRHFLALLTRMEALPAGAARGSGSLEHAQTLASLARCLLTQGSAPAAETRLRQAWAEVECLLKGAPGNRLYAHEHAVLLISIADLHTHEGRAEEARVVYQLALDEFRSNDDAGGEATALTRLGSARYQANELADAEADFDKALAHFRRVRDSSREAGILNMLGDIAVTRERSADAEGYYRESLAINERNGDADGVAKSSGGLAIIAATAGRSAEAEGWLRYALRFPGIPPLREGAARSNLARSIVEEVRSGRASPSRLGEARGEAVRALRIQRRLGSASEPWKTLDTVATVAELRARDQVAAEYRRREREAYAAFEGNQAKVDGQFGTFIRMAAAAAQHEQAQVALLGPLPQPLACALQRLWAGERDWHALSATLDRDTALVVRRVLDALAPAAQQDRAVPAALDVDPETIMYPSPACPIPTGP